MGNRYLILALNVRSKQQDSTLQLINIRVPSSELLLHLGVQMLQQVGPPLQQAVHAPVDVLEAVARVAEEPPLVLPGVFLGGRPQASRVEQVLEDDVDVELAAEVPA